jgi:hypothetical protein
MHRFCLAILRFSISAWFGVALFFNLVVLDALDSVLTERLVAFNHPGAYLRAYDGLALGLLGAALISACAGLWNAHDALLRKCAIATIVFAAFAIAFVNWVTVDRRILEILKRPTEIPAAQFVELCERSRFLKETLLLLSAAAVIAAFWPVHSGPQEGPGSGTAQQPSQPSAR